MGFDFSKNAPIYTQLIEHFKMNIIVNKWSSGEKIPSVRELALNYGVNPNTVQRALSELERSQLVYSERTSGRFITKDTKLIQTIRKNLICQKIENFIVEMKQLNVSLSEMTELLTVEWEVIK